MASRQTRRPATPSADTSTFYPDPWVHGVAAAPVDRLILANHRASQLAALIATRLEAMTADDTAADLSPTVRDELGGLGLAAVQIRQLLAEVTRLAGAYA